MWLHRTDKRRYAAAALFQTCRCRTDVPARTWQYHHSQSLQQLPPVQRQQQQQLDTERAMMPPAQAQRRALAGANEQQQHVYTIPTYVHVVVVTDPGVTTGNVTQEAIDKQMALMNSAYSSNTAQAGIKWDFKVMNVTYSGTPSDHDMCKSESEEQNKQQLRKGGRDSLNLYITDLSACGVLGYSTWPWDLDKHRNGLVMDGVVVHFDTLPGGNYALYNLGGTAVHETGHWLGMFHTFENGCVPPGDGVDDTPYCTRPDDVHCPKHRDSCPQPGEDPVDNWMGYGVDACMKTFTVGQHQRIEQVWKRYRAAN